MSSKLTTPPLRNLLRFLIGCASGFGEKVRNQNQQPKEEKGEEEEEEEWRHEEGDLH